MLDKSTAVFPGGVALLWKQARVFSLAAALCTALWLAGIARMVVSIRHVAEASTSAGLNELFQEFLLYGVLGPLVLFPVINLKLRSVLRKSRGVATS